jgi:predicted dehydrogenase
VLTNQIDFGLNVQEAGDASRWQHEGDNEPTGEKMNPSGGYVEVESGIPYETVRKLRFFQPHQYLSIDYARQDLLIINVAQGENGNAALAANKPAIQGGEPLLLEIKAFLDSVKNRTGPRVTAEQARDALALALDINQAIQAHAIRAGLV